MLRALKSRTTHSLNKHFRCFLPVIICIYLLVGLLLFVILQGNMNSWVSFMESNGAMALLGVYAVAGVLGIGLTWFLKKDPDLLAAPRKILVTSFLLAIIVGACMFTYLNFAVTQANYVWMNDGFTYQQMGQSFLVNHEFIVNGSLTHHFGPVFPLFLSLFYAVLPVHLGTQIADEIIFLSAILVVFYVTRKMYGSTPAIITTALATTIPIYIFGASRNYAEPIVLILYTLTVYFLLESLKPQKENRIILAGIAAALGILTKSSFGVFVIIPVAAVLLWRFNYMGWKMFKNKNYIVAVIVLLGSNAAWTVRNIHDFWNGSFWNLLAAAQPSIYMDQAQAYVFTNQVGGFLVESLFFAAFTLIFASAYIWFFKDYLQRAWKRIREERLSGLLLMIVLPFITSVLATALYFVYENYWMPDYLISYWPVSQVRYLIYELVRYYFIALVPLSWLAYEAKKAKA
jgi:4-amino-4-deoxy-L-arabinose transferase-like glycosyltransferase